MHLLTPCSFSNKWAKFKHAFEAMLSPKKGAIMRIVWVERASPGPADDLDIGEVGLPETVVLSLNSRRL
jgi:hypothetical protein